MDEMDNAVEEDSAAACFRRDWAGQSFWLADHAHGSLDSPSGSKAQVLEGVA